MKQPINTPNREPNPAVQKAVEDMKPRPTPPSEELVHNNTVLMNIGKIARIAHEANRAYCILIGDNSQKPWNEAPEWQKISAVHGVKFIMANPSAPPSASHDNWFRQKQADGWIYGPVKDEAKKQHPCMVPFGELSIEQQTKDIIFGSVVRGCIAADQIL